MRAKVIVGLVVFVSACSTPQKSMNRQGLFDYLNDRQRARSGPSEEWGPRIPQHRVSKAMKQWQWPLESVKVTSEYGMRSGRMHEGLDLAATKGTPVFAVQEGTVIHADDILNGYGNLVIIEHPSGLMSLYAHNSKMFVERGDYVKKGDTIALVGKTGHASGPHLHFEVRNQGEAFDPLEYMDLEDRAYASER